MAKILIIDDSLLSRTMMSNVLKDLGHEPIVASNGEEGIKLAIEQEPDCITLDLLLPGMSGREILNALREKEIHIPVAIVTSDTQESTKEQCLKLGATCVLNKPVKKKNMENVINKFLKP